MSIEEKSIVFSCCFCSEPITENVAAIVLLAQWSTPDERRQQFWCHLKCCADAMDPSYAREIAVGP